MEFSRAGIVRANDRIRLVGVAIAHLESAAFGEQGVDQFGLVAADEAGVGVDQGGDGLPGFGFVDPLFKGFCLSHAQADKSAEK